MAEEKKHVRLINPFITGEPVSALRFIGRREQVNTILSQLANPQSRGSSALSGEQRIGKTSLLHYIVSPDAEMRYLPPDKFIFVSVDSSTLGTYMNSLGLQTLTEDLFWRYIAQCLTYPTQRASSLIRLSRILGFKRQAKALGRSVRLHKQDKIGIFDLIRLSEQIAANGRLAVLLLDEFEWIINNIDLQRPILLNTLRSLINLPIEKRGFALITSSEKPLSVLCEGVKFTGSPFPNVLVPVHLRPFSPNEAHELIDTYLEDAAITFSGEDRGFAYNLSKGHPYWLQRVCFELFNRYLEKAEATSVQGSQITMVLKPLDYEKIVTKITEERECASISYIIREREKEAELAPKAVLDITKYSNIELAMLFFTSAEFMVKNISANIYTVKSSRPPWTEWGELLVYCFEESDVRGDDVRRVANATIVLKGTDEANRAFIVHSGRLIEGAARQLWEYKTQHELVIIPIHVTTLREQLVERGRNPNACSEALFDLERKWSSLDDPYQSIDSEADSQWFFGSKRRMATAGILQQIDEGVKAALIHGMRRVGKSAFLNQIYRDCRSRGYLTAKLVSKYGSPCHDILNDIKQELTSNLTELYPGINVPDSSVFTRRYDANTFSTFKQELLQLAEALSRHTGKAAKIVILLDEVDWIFPGQGSSDAEYISYCNLFQTLKEVLEMPDKPGLLSLVVAMESPLVDRVNVFPHNERFQNPMFGRFKTRIRLLFMDREDLDEMIQTIGQLHGLEYSRDGLKRIFKRTQGHVDLARKLCSHITLFREREKLTGNVTTEDIAKAEESLLEEESEYFLGNLWNDQWSLNLEAEQLVLLELASSPDCSETELEKKLLLKDDSTQMRQRIYYARNRLKDLGLIKERERENELYYHLTIPMYQRWIRDYLPDVEKPGGWP